MAYFYYRALGNAQLAAIGLLSFAASRSWRRHSSAACSGGAPPRAAPWAACWSASRSGIYTLFLPSFLEGNTAGMLFLQHGPFGIEALRPRALLGADLPPLLHGVLWSLSLNLLTYIVLSLVRQPSSIERVQADLFVPTRWRRSTPNFRRWRTTVTVQDISEHGRAISRPRPRTAIVRDVRRHAPHQSRPYRARRFPAAASCRTSDRLVDRRGVLAPRAVAAAAQAHGVHRGGAEAARRRPRGAALQPRDAADRAQPCAAGHRGVRRGTAADLFEPAVRRNSRPAAAPRADRRFRWWRFSNSSAAISPPGFSEPIDSAALLQQAAGRLHHRRGALS